MDAYSLSISSSDPGHASRRIYQDLIAVPFLRLAHLAPSQRRCSSAMEGRQSRSRPAGRNPPRIGVVGAGVAGLRCADMLLQHGLDVTVLEGRNRLGGRLHQERLPNGHLVDVGPNWIHGTQSNPILDLARLTQTPASSWDAQSFVFGEDGRLLAEADGNACSEMMWEIVQRAFTHSERSSADISPHESLLDFFRTKTAELIPETEPGFARKRDIVLQMAELWGAFVGSPIDRQSLKFFWLEECIEGENLFCAGTYQAILEEISRPAVNAAAVRLDTIVTRIHGKSVANGLVRVETAAGDVFDFDDVVLTAPLGWLKKNPGAFHPPLPSRLTDAIGNISYGCLEKVYLSFPEAFWRRPDADGRTVRGFCQWLSPSYAGDTNPQRWTLEVVELASLTPPGAAHPTLLFYIYGDQSRHITSALRDLDTREKKDAFLLSFFAPYYSRLPHFSEADPACRPSGCFATDWLHDDLAGNGSYGNFQTGLRAGDDDIRVMREGVQAEGLWLAGEHTAPFVALGTVTGAYWSGELVGRRIAEAHGLGKAAVMPEGLADF